MDNNNNINNKNNNNPNRSQATTSSSTDFVLQWGNRKRLRCMKQQQQLTKDEKLPLGQRSITARGDRRNKDSLSNGGINLRQRSSSPAAHRVLRNCESITIGMKGGHQSNGDNKRNNHKNNNGGNGSGGSSETGAKSSSGNEMMVWPPKFAIGLTNKEKEEDFLAIKGSKLPQRPKKRAKFIQRTINLVCPGGWLCDLTLERYEVREKKITKKRPRGLKAMGSIESESE